MKKTATTKETLQLDHFHTGDVLEKLKLLPDKCVRCIVTSPPYYGLRDYGTATWIGGDDQCRHEGFKRKNATGRISDEHKQSTNNHSKDISHGDCIKCGAIRIDMQIGLEKTPKEYISKMVAVFRECRRVLTDDGTLWLNIGDSYWGGKGQSGDARPDIQKERLATGKSIQKIPQNIGEKGKTSPLQHRHSVIKPKDLVGIPWTLAFALRDDGWYLRSDIIWFKENPMPESVTDRPTKAHEYIFLLTKNSKYYYDAIAIRQPLAKSVLKDKRLYDENYTTGRPDRNYPGQSSPVAGLLKRKSGNLERKDRPGAPEDTGKHQKGSVPWEGGTANKKSVWSVKDDYTLWDWLFANAPLDIVAPLWENWIQSKSNKGGVWKISTKPYKGAHFATFPEDLIIDCIKAGTSEYGQCSACGRPWVRITEKLLQPTYKASHNTQRDHRDDLADANDQGSNRVKDGHKPGYYNEYTTTGWMPSCKCIADNEQPPTTIPDVVLDPFGGAGTTPLVAKKLNRNFIAIEINPAYVRIAEKRLKDELGMFASSADQQPEETVPDSEQAKLFVE